jgi:hypothetical protein
MVNTLRAGGAVTTNDAMNLIALGEQKFCEIGTVLTSDAGD